MDSRKEYQHQKYVEQKEKRLAKQKKYYKDHKEERLTYQSKYDKLNWKKIRMAKLSRVIHTPANRIAAIFLIFKKYARRWKLPCIKDSQEFQKWANDDKTFKELYEAWKVSGYERGLSPVCMRTKKKNGFVIDNLVWKKRSDYSWWSEAQEIREQMEAELDAKQAATNKATPEEHKKARAMWESKNKRSK